MALVEWLSPLFAPGHWVPEQVEQAGGVSVIGEAGERSRESPWDALAAARTSWCWACAALICRAAFDAPEPLTRTRAWRDGQIWANRRLGLHLAPRVTNAVTNWRNNTLYDNNLENVQNNYIILYPTTTLCAPWLPRDLTQ